MSIPGKASSPSTSTGGAGTVAAHDPARGGAGSSVAEATSVATQLQPSFGKTTISDTVVAKIAGLATREVPGVAGFGGGTARALGALRERIPGARVSSSQGVGVEVGERQAAVDLTLVVEYGVGIVELAREIRRNVITSLEQMTGLEVVEVNIAVVDLQVPGEDSSEQPVAHTTRVE
jgi:uncharacterized alkaline shock family protein YloU